jgi:replicative DNA helicase
MELMHKGPVAFSSLEMSTEQLLTRLIAARGRVHMNNLMSNTLSAEQWVKVQSMRLDILKMPLYVDERSGVNVTQIKAFARSVSRKGPIAGVVVDYLQLVTGGDGRQNRTEVVGEISRQLKILARELDCPVVALSQLNRESVKGGHRRPTLGDLRESGSIEQDADVVMLLQREVDKNDNELDTLAVWVAKNRHGQQGMKKLLWEGQYARLSPLQYGFGGFAGLGD